MYRHIAALWKKPSETGLEPIIRERAIRWRRGPTIVRLDRPTRLNRARALGYRAKQGFIVARVRVRHGGLRKLRPKAGRRQKKMGVLLFTPAKSLKFIAQQRAASKFPNLKALNAYWLWKDGKYEWYEVVMVDPHHPSIINDPQINWVCNLN